MPTSTVTLTQLGAEFTAAAARLRQPATPLLKPLSVAATADAKRNFDESADPDGKPWASLAFPRASGGTQPLRDKGLLLASLSGGPNHVERYADWSVTVGTNRIGANLHQFGGTIVPRQAQWLTIPATREAARVGSPVDFPRPLAFLIGRSGRGGVMVERAPPSPALARGTGPRRRRRPTRPVKQGPRAKGPGTVQYFLTKQVVVPARVFLGAGARLLGTLSRLAGDYLGRLGGSTGSLTEER
jgi:phage gpG-like protein